MPRVPGEPSLLPQMEPRGASSLVFTPGNASSASAYLNDTTHAGAVTLAGVPGVNVTNCSFGRLTVTGAATVWLSNVTFRDLVRVTDAARVNVTRGTMTGLAVLQAGGTSHVVLDRGTYTAVEFLGESTGECLGITAQRVRGAVQFTGAGTLLQGVPSGSFETSLRTVDCSVAQREVRLACTGTGAVTVNQTVLRGVNASGATRVTVDASQLGGTTSAEDTASLHLRACRVDDRLLCWDAATLVMAACSRVTPTTTVSVYAYQHGTLRVTGGHFTYLYCFASSNTTLEGALFDYHCYGGSPTVSVDETSSVGANACSEDAREISWDQFFLGLTVILGVTIVGYVVYAELKGRRAGKTRWKKREGRDGARKGRGLPPTTAQQRFSRHTREVLAPTCPNCGGPLTPSLLDECRACGKKFCPGCGAPQGAHPTRCHRCGREFRQEEV